MTSPVDSDLIALLVARDGLPTEVIRRDRGPHRVVNIAWGYDYGDAYAHVTTNISPRVPGACIGFFFTSEVTSVRDPVSGNVLLETSWP